MDDNKIFNSMIPSPRKDVNFKTIYLKKTSNLIFLKNV